MNKEVEKAIMIMMLCHMGLVWNAARDGKQIKGAREVVDWFQRLLELSIQRRKIANEDHGK